MSKRTLGVSSSKHGSLSPSSPSGAAAKALGPAVREMVRQCVDIFAARNGNCDELMKLVSPHDRQNLITALALVAAEAGSAQKLARSSLHRTVDQVMRQDHKPAAALTDVAFASRFVTAFLDAIVGDFLKEVVRPLARFAAKDEKPLELDPKMGDGPAIKRNSEKLEERVRDFLKHFTADAMIKKFPKEASYMLRVIGEIAGRHGDEEDITAAVGVAFVRSFSAMVANPGEYGVDKPMSAAALGNLKLMLNIVSHVATGEVYVPGEDSHMMIMNECVMMNAWRIQSFVVKLAAGTQHTKSWTEPAPEATRFPGIAEDGDYGLLHKVFTGKLNECVDCFRNAQAAAEFKRTALQLKHFHSLKDLPAQLSGSEPATITISIRVGDDVYEDETQVQQAEVASFYKGVAGKLDKAEKKSAKGRGGSTGASAIRAHLRRRAGPAEDEPEAETSFNLFGAPINEALSQEQEVRPDAKLPKFVEQICDHVTLKGLDQEGIFRISGQKGEMEEMEADINAGRTLVIDRDSTNVHNLTGLLKKYVRDLPSPLLTTERYEPFLQVIRQYPEDDQLPASFEALKALFDELPKENYNLLETLFRMLYQVHINNSVNMMTANNLGVVFGPNLLYTEGGDNVANLTNSEDVKNVTARMVEGYPVIFRDVLTQRELEAKPVAVKKRIVAHSRSVSNIMVAKFTNTPDSERVLVTTSNTVVAFWDPFTGEKKKEIDLEDFIFSVDHDMRGSLWASTENAVIVISLEDLSVVSKITDRGGGSCITLVNTEMWMNSMQENHISCFHASRREFYRQLPGHEEGISTMRLLSEGCVWVATLKNSIVVLDIRTGQAVATITETKRTHGRRITSLCKVGSRICCGSEDGTLSFMNEEAKTYERALEGHDGNIKQCTEFDGNLWTCSWDMSIRVWDISTLRLKYEMLGYHSDVVSGLAFIEDSSKNWWLWSSSNDRHIMLFKVNTAAQQLSLGSSGGLLAPEVMNERHSSVSAGSRGTPKRGFGPKRGASFKRGAGPKPALARGHTPPGLAEALAARQGV